MRQRHLLETVRAVDVEAAQPAPPSWLRAGHEQVACSRVASSSRLSGRPVTCRTVARPGGADRRACDRPALALDNAFTRRGRRRRFARPPATRSRCSRSRRSWAEARTARRYGHRVELEPDSPRLRPGSSTAAVHGGSTPQRPWPRGPVTPVFQSTTFELDDAAYEDIARTGGTEIWWYTRLGNPTVDAVAAKLAALEGAEAGLAFASGMAAITSTVMCVLRPGQRIVAARELYGETFTLLHGVLPATGRAVSFVAVDDLDGWRRELRGADVAYLETLSNPMLRVANLPAIAALAREAGVTAVIDSTFASPVNVRPLEHGFDLVVHSATKYLNGHADLVAGVVAGSHSRIAAIRALAKTFGGCLDPAAAAKLDRSLKTLVVRMERHNENALAIARWLESNDEIEAVAYPLLDSHADVELATRLLRGGSGIVTLRVRGGDARAGAVMDSLQLIVQATSLGGVESLISAPYNTSHRQLNPSQLAALGILPGTLRLSVGIEDVGDLITDLDQALAATAARVERITR
ncbi:MAG: trans-sulfuration enzyme family protein [Solirubrobacteraceae bacterium]